MIDPQVRSQLVASLAKLPDGEPLSFTRLQDMLGLTPDNLITHLRRLKDAGYIRTEKAGSGAASWTAMTLTPGGRAALDAYTGTLSGRLGGRLTGGPALGSGSESG